VSVSNIRFNFSGVVSSGGICTTEPPVYESCAPECCRPTCGYCDPRVPLRDYILIKPRTEETCITLGTAVCSAEVVSAARSCIELRINRRGECATLLVLKPLRATLEGAACFSWPVEWWRLSDGDYEADVYVNGCSCLTIGLRMVGCSMALMAYSQTMKSVCGDGLPCGLPQNLCVTPVDDVPQALPASQPCETC
jgi:hypothetical protein